VIAELGFAAGTAMDTSAVQNHPITPTNCDGEARKASGEDAALDTAKL
jgi:hypothetical protein